MEGYDPFLPFSFSFLLASFLSSPLPSPFLGLGMVMDFWRLYSANCWVRRSFLPFALRGVDWTWGSDTASTRHADQGVCTRWLSISSLPAAQRTAQQAAAAANRSARALEQRPGKPARAQQALDPAGGPRAARPAGRGQGPATSSDSPTGAGQATVQRPRGPRQACCYFCFCFLLLMLELICMLIWLMLISFCGQLLLILAC